MALHEGVTITDVDQLFTLSRQGVVFRDCHFDGADLAGFDAEEMVLENCTARGTDFPRLLCTSLRATGSDFEGACFEQADIQEAEFRDCSCAAADFRGARLNLSRMLNCDLSLCRFDGAGLFGADLSGSRLRAADLTDAKLDAVKLDGADLSMAALRGKVFRDYRFVGVNFAEADISGCDFTQATFESCHLNSAVVSEESRFDGADLRGAHISGSLLGKASLRGAIITAAQADRMLSDRFGIVVVPG